jgi:nucleotide-binding universal stress UspA family protein
MVLLIPPSAPEARIVHYRRLLVPLDGSSRAESTLPLALRLAKAEGAELLLAHVVPVPELTEVGPLEAGDLELRGQLVRRNERVAHDYLDRIRARVVKGGISARALVLCDGDVRSRLARAIVDEAVDLVVLSAQGRSGHSDVPFGSVAAYLIAHAVAPLLIMCRHSVRATRRVAAAGGRLTSHATQ